MNRPSTARCPGGFDLKGLAAWEMTGFPPPEGGGRRLRHHPRYNDDDIVPIAVAFDEAELRERLKRIRARWEPQIKMWFAPYRLIRGTPLEAKIAAV